MGVGQFHSKADSDDESSSRNVPVFTEMRGIFESIRIALDSISANIARSFLTILGIVVGVGVVVMIAALLEGAQRFIVNATAQFAPDVVRIEKAAFQDFGFDGQAFIEAQSKRPDILREDLEFLQNRLGDSFEVGAQSDASLPARRGAKTLIGIAVQGVTPNITELSNVRIAAGRSLTSTDENFRRNVCVIGQDLMDEFFSSMDPIGEEIRLGQLPFEVVGVAEPRGSQFGNSQDGFVQIPLGTFGRIFGTRSRSLALLAKPRDTVTIPADEADEQIRVAMRIRRKLVSTAKEDNFSLLTAKSIKAFSGNLTGIVGAIVFPMTAVALLVSGVVVMNMMLASVTERTREIGVRMALGARRRDILTQFLIETIILTLSGGVLGIAVATVLVWMVVVLTTLPLTVPLWSVFAAIGVSCLVGIVFGVIPARQASKLNPIEALRTE